VAGRWRWLRFGLIGVLFLGELVGLALLNPLVSRPASTAESGPLAPNAVTYAADGFNRNVSGGWGSAQVGGSYEVSGSSQQRPAARPGSHPCLTSRPGMSTSVLR
jgi:hypothetical protein